MEPKIETLGYARELPTAPRPATYRLVITILFSVVAFVLGLLATIVFFVLLLQVDWKLLSIVPFAVAILFFYYGYRSLTVAVRFLRCRTPGKNWERWVFSIWPFWM